MVDIVWLVSRLVLIFMIDVGLAVLLMDDRLMVFNVLRLDGLVGIELFVVIG